MGAGEGVWILDIPVINQELTFIYYKGVVLLCPTYIQILQCVPLLFTLVNFN